MLNNKYLYTSFKLDNLLLINYKKNFRLNDNNKLIKYYFNTFYDNHTYIKYLNIYDYCIHKYDNINENINNFKLFNNKFSIKDTKNKKYYLAFFEEVNNLTLDDFISYIDILYNIWVSSIEYNKYYGKFLRRIKFNIITNLHLVIKINNFNINYLSIINDFINNEHHIYKKEFYDFINIHLLY